MSQKTEAELKHQLFEYETFRNQSTDQEEWDVWWSAMQEVQSELNRLYPKHVHEHPDYPEMGIFAGYGEFDFNISESDLEGQL